jgi:hypothetical protein
MDRCPICETRTVRRGWPTRWRISRVEIDKHGATEDQIYGPLAADESVVVVPLSDAERLREALERYGTHRAECATNTAPPRRGPCDCGWAALDREGENADTHERRKDGTPVGGDPPLPDDRPETMQEHVDALDRKGEGKFKGATSDSPFTGKDREG